MLFERVERLHPNTLLVNTGGVCTFYPTDVEYQPRATPLAERPDGDLTGAVVDR